MDVRSRDEGRTQPRDQELAPLFTELIQNLVATRDDIAQLRSDLRERPSAGRAEDAARKLHLSGRTGARGGGNIVLVGDHEVLVPDSSFSRLLFLVVSRLESGNEFIHGEAFVSCGRSPIDRLARDNGPYRAKSRLSNLLRPFLGSDFIEVRDRHFRLQPDLQVSWDRERLLRHPNPGIADLAAQLPES